MSNVSRPLSVASTFFCLITCLAAPALRAQVVLETPLHRHLSRIDLGVSGVGHFTGNVSGTNYFNRPLIQKTSTTLGALITLRYIKSPLIGFEGNYGYVRYTENYSAIIIGGAQTKATEYTLGYVAHAPTILGVQPFGAVGLGSIAFRPTPGGGQGLPTQARAAYYYSLGAEDSIFSKHFGIRAQFRQVFFKAPDFGQNYLTINKRTSTYEPGIGFYLKF